MPPIDATSDETSASPSEQDGGRPEQHGPEMDDTQVEATGELADTFEPAQPDADPGDGSVGADPA